MAKKIDIDLMKAAMQRKELDVRTIASVVEEIERELQLQEQEKEKTPPQKKQFCIVVSDPNGELPDTDLTGWVVQIPEEESPLSATQRIIDAAYDFNQTPKGRRMPAQTIGEACEAVPARMTKDKQVWIKTKEPVLVVRTDNSIPRISADEL
jgi:hypothetical protein